MIGQNYLNLTSLFSKSALLNIIIERPYNLFNFFGIPCLLYILTIKLVVVFFCQFTFLLEEKTYAKISPKVIWVGYATSPSIILIFSQSILKSCQNSQIHHGSLCWGRRGHCTLCSKHEKLHRD